MKNEKLRILFLSHEGHTAGSTYSISYLTRGLAEREHHVVLGCKQDSLLHKITVATTVKHALLPFANKLDFVTVKNIANIVKTENIDLINAQSGVDRYLSIWARIFYRTRAKIVHTRRQKPESIGGSLQNWFYTRFTSGIVAVSRSVKTALVKKGIPEQHITVIFNGTPKSKYELPDIENRIVGLKKQYNFSEDQIVIGCVSRRKKQEQLIQAVRQIKEPLVIFFIGIEEDDQLRKHRKAVSSIHEFHYLGTVPQQDLLYFYHLFNIKVLSSTMEGTSQALLEAMASGTPVIATNASGNPDLIKHKINGLLFEDGNINQLAKYIRLLVENQKLRESIIKNAQKTALEDFSISKMLDKYEQYYFTLLKQNG